MAEQQRKSIWGRRPQHTVCVGCNHLRHQTPCAHPKKWWLRWLTGQGVCGCVYWDAMWAPDPWDPMRRPIQPMRLPRSEAEVENDR